MSEDLFEFWSRCPGPMLIHPDDAEVLARAPHSFNLKCLPSPFTGRLRDAPVVLLFMAPGFHEYDLEHAKMPSAQAWYAAQRTGTEPLSREEEHRTHNQWWRRIVRQFDLDEEVARQGIAILDLAPYHSATFNDVPMLSALPSARKAVDWAQSVLFPAAIAGDRLVICLRSAAYWGLNDGTDGRTFGKALHCPKFNRSGVMLHGPQRQIVCQEVRKRLGA